MYYFKNRLRKSKIYFKASLYNKMVVRINVTIKKKCPNSWQYNVDLQNCFSNYIDL